MVYEFGRLVERRANFDESLSDKDWLAAIAVLPSLSIGVIGSGVPFRAELLALCGRGDRAIWPRAGVLAHGPTDGSLPSARRKWIRPGAGAGR